MQKTITTVMVMTKLEKNKIGVPDFGNTDVVGFFHDEKEADEAVKNNACDMWEHTYDYALIETIKEGIYSLPLRRQFYKFNITKNKYEPIDEPSFLKPYCGFSMR